MQLLLDEASLLAFAAYVDLNPVRAALAKTPESSEFTGAKDRIDDLKAQSVVSSKTHDWERSRSRTKSGWMSPVEIDERHDPVGPDVDRSGRRASRKGFLSLPLSQYLELLDWTGRQLRKDKAGRIPSELTPILQRTGLDASGWCAIVKKFGTVFKRAAGTQESLKAEASRRGLGWLQSPGNVLGGV